jgi:hypothetical protein
VGGVLIGLAVLFGAIELRKVEVHGIGIDLDIEAILDNALGAGIVNAVVSPLQTPSHSPSLTLLARCECYSGMVGVKVKVSSGQILLLFRLRECLSRHQRSIS